jgi:hypothetical protein
LLDDYASHISLLQLADTKDATEGLLFDCVVPPEIEGYDAVSPWEIEAMEGLVIGERRRGRGKLPDTTTLQACDQDFDFRVGLESGDRFVAVFLGGVACEVEEAPFLGLADTTDDACEGAELDVHDNLATVSNFAHEEYDKSNERPPTLSSGAS